MFKNLGIRLSQSITEINSTYWSLTKLGILIFMYPTITFLIIYDTVINKRLDWLNLSVFITGIVAPRMVSQIVAARFGYVDSSGKIINNDNSIDARVLNSNLPEYRINNINNIDNNNISNINNN
jgi:hypothetical protein